MTQTPETAAASLNQGFAGQLWKKVGLAVSSAAMPFGLLLAPEVTGQLIKNEWTMWCLAAVGGLGLIAGTVKLHDRFRQNWGEFIRDGVSSTGLAAAATLGLLKTAEWNMAGDLMANGWIRAGEVTGSIVIGSMISRSLWDRWQERRSAAALAKAKKIDYEHIKRYREIKARVEHHQIGRTALEILYETMSAISNNGGAVTEDTQKEIAVSALQVAQGIPGAEEQLLIYEGAANRAGRLIKARMVALDGTIDNKAVESLARPTAEAKKLKARLVLGSRKKQ